MSTKKRVLEILTSQKAASVSGEVLATECGVSRAAIWKAVKTLRQEGFTIEGTQNGGYSLIQNIQEDVLSQEMLKYTLGQTFPEYADCHIECFRSLDSTNTYAKKLLLEPDKNLHHTIITAEAQTAGRGRIGRTFESPAGTGVYVSLIITPEGGITKPALITTFAAVAVCRAIKNVYGVQTYIKWINDIYVKNNGELKKCTGILTEGITNFETGQIESAVIGIGVNLSPSEQIKKSTAGNIAGYITDGTSGIPRCRFIAEITGQVFNILNEPVAKVINEYKSQLFLIGKTLTVHPLIGDDKTAYTATAIDIDEEAGLIVKLPDGTEKTLSSGEVTLH